MARAARYRNDPVALRKMRDMGMTLSQEEIELLGGEAGHTDGKLDMEKLLARLLAALGIDVPETGDFKFSLMQCALQKVIELTGKGRRAASGANNQAKEVTNPLIPGGGAEMAPIYMSLMDRLRAEREHLVMQKHATDIQLAMAPPAPLSAEAESAIVDSMARRMGAVPEQRGAALGMEAAEDRAVAALARFMR